MIKKKGVEALRGHIPSFLFKQEVRNDNKRLYRHCR